MKLFSYLAAVLGLMCSVAEAAIMVDTDGNNRPTSISSLTIAGNDYDVTFQYVVAQSTTSGIGDLPLGDLSAAITELLGTFNSPSILVPNAGFDPMDIQFVISTGAGVYDTGGTIRYSSSFDSEWFSFGSGQAGLSDSASEVLGVVRFDAGSASSVPEPSSLALLAMATCGGVLVYRKNRKTD